VHNVVFGKMARAYERVEMIERNPMESSHQHWCEVYGHYYQCGEDCVCICGLTMNGNDHTDCPVELRACPEHRAERERDVADAMSCEKQTEIVALCEEQDAVPPHCECGCSDIDPGEIVGWCLHCDHVYAEYTPSLQDWHFANHCPVAPETLKEAARTGLCKRAKVVE
jgi:hypothetical protein